MGCQPRLVLFLLLALGAIQATLTSTPRSIHIIHDDIRDNELDSVEEVKPITISSGIKISTPKVKQAPPPKANTIGGKKISSVEVFDDLLLASKHHSSLPPYLKDSPVLSIPHTEENTQSTGSKNKNKSEENYDLDDEDDYNYDYYEDYNPDESAGHESTKKAKSAGKVTNNSVNKATKKKVNNVSQLKPIEENEDKHIPKNDEILNQDDDNNMDNNTDNFDDEDDYDDEDGDDDEDVDDDDDADDGVEDDIADEEEIVFNENVPCPRDCICARNINNYMVATCSRLDLDKQKFGSDITDLVVTDVGPKYPIMLGPDFFVKIGLKHVSTIKIANCTVEYLHQTAFHGLDVLYSVNLTNVGLAIINPDTFASNKKLRLLTITGNDLSIMSTVHYLLKSSSLEEVDVSRNNLMELNPSAFSQLTNVVYINLSQNNLQKIPERVFDNLGTLEELDLSYNTLKTLPPTIFNRTALAILRLRYNEITGDLRFGSADLQQLDLSFNSIKQIHHGMFDKLQGLTNLMLKGNGITKIQPDSFLALRNLRNIDLSINELDQISSLLFYRNSELDVVRLNDNPRLSQLPTDGFQSHNGFFPVYYLDISNCAIGALGHKTFATMPRLTTLKLAWNNINNLERDTFATLRMLNELDLSNNLIVKLDELMFKYNNDLTKLSLAGNPIRKLNLNLFLYMQKLTHLDVSECELHSLLSSRQYGVGVRPKIFDTLRSFNASANQIKKISASDVKNFKNLRTLDISHNPLKCNEEFQEFINYVSVRTNTSPNRNLPLENLESDDALVSFEAQEGWVPLAREVCKHHVSLSPESKEKDGLKKRTNPVEKVLNERGKHLLDMQILSDSRKSNMINDQNKLHAESEKDFIKTDEEKVVVFDDNDEEENVSDYDDEEQDEDDDDDNEKNVDDDDEEEEEEVEQQKKAENNYERFAKKKIDPTDPTKLKEHEITIKGAELSKGNKDHMLLDKFLLNGDDSSNSDEDTDEIIIERGRIYYSGLGFLIPIIVALTCVLIMLLAIGKIVTMVMRKRGERYRMALLASSKNSIVYQKLSEEIKPSAKELKQPKVHRYTPIHQV